MLAPDEVADGRRKLGVRNDDDWVDRHPEAERATLLVDAEGVDSSSTPVLPADGPRIVVVECLDDENGIMPDDRRPTEDDFAIILRGWLATGHALTGTVGGAHAELIESADFVEFGARWTSANLR